MVKYVIIRDDDTSFFTSPRMLEEVYEEIFAMQIPINLSIIPQVKGNIKTKNNIYTKISEQMYEPFIPKEHRQKTLAFPVYENTELIQFLKDRNEVLELIQHGLSHSKNEFSSLNAFGLKKKLISGRDTFKRAFNTTPNFFSAPYDTYSSLSLLLLKRYFRGVTCGDFFGNSPFDLAQALRRFPVPMIPSYVKAIRRRDAFFFDDGFLVLGHKGTSINAFTDISKIKCDLEALFQNERVIVIAQHYWEYFYVRKQGYVGDCINKKLYNGFIEIVQKLKDKGANFLKVSQLHKKLYR